MTAHLLAVLVVRTLMAWRWLKAAAKRGLVLSLSLMAVTGVSWAQASGSVVSEPMALGLIVKLKDAGGTQASIASASVVRLAATRLPQDSASAQQQRLTQALQRRGVRNLGHRATAFAARAMRFDAPMTRAQAEAQAELLRADPDVEWVAVDEVLQAHAYRGEAVDPGADPYYNSNAQMWLQPRLGISDRAGLADFPAAWARLVGRSLTPVTVAVLDSGVPQASDWEHADLAGRLWPGYDFVSQTVYSRDGNGVDDNPTDPGNWLTAADITANTAAYTLEDGSRCAVQSSDWHGLHVSYSVAAAAGNKLFGMGALAPLRNDAGWEVVLPVRVAGNCGASLSDIIEGMLWSAGVSYQGSPTANRNPARVINLSFGAKGSCLEAATGSVGWLYRQTVAALAQKGALVVASAGNGDATTHLGLTAPTRPANCVGVLAVTSLNTRGYKASYANLIDGTGSLRGVAVASGDNSVDLQGQLVLSDEGFGTLANKGTQSPVTGPNAYKMVSNEVGTSFAAPQAAAVAALMLAVDPSLTVAELLQRITDSAQAFTPREGLNDCSATNTGRCNCTVTTCGSGVLDAEAAVASALDHAVSGTTPFVPGDVTVSFTPDRANTSTASASGGGGATGVAELPAALVLALVLAVRACGRRLNLGRRQKPCPAATSGPTT